MDAACHVHKDIGPGLLESAYKECLYYELKEREMNVLMEVGLPLVYKNLHLDCRYRLDLWVEKK